MNYINKETAQEIVNTVKEVCTYDINFINENGIIIASTDHSRIDSFHEVGQKVFHTGKTISVYDDNDYLGTRRGINMPVTYNDTVIAVIGISGDPETVRKYAYLTQHLTATIIKERDIDLVVSQKKSRLNYVIRCLIRGEPIDTAYFNAVMKEQHISMDELCRTIIIHMHETDDFFALQSIISNTFASINASFYRYNYPNEYILILSEPHYRSHVKQLNQLALENKEKVKIGVGNAVRITSSAQSYRHAASAVQCASQDFPFAVYDDLDLELMLSNVTPDIKEQFLHKTIQALSEDDKHLLKTYFQLNMSLKETSEQLFIHKNSLQYKLNRIYTITGYNPRIFADAAVLYTALKTESLR